MPFLSALNGLGLRQRQYQSGLIDLFLGFVLSSANEIAAPQMIPRIIVLIISATMREREKANDPYQSRNRYSPDKEAEYRSDSYSGFEASLLIWDVDVKESNYERECNFAEKIKYRL